MTRKIGRDIPGIQILVSHLNKGAIGYEHNWNKLKINHSSASRKSIDYRYIVKITTRASAWNEGQQQLLVESPNTFVGQKQRAE